MSNNEQPAVVLRVLYELLAGNEDRIEYVHGSEPHYSPSDKWPFFLVRQDGVTYKISVGVRG